MLLEREEVMYTASRWVHRTNIIDLTLQLITNPMVTFFL